jgi:RsiW-degrading membrane proteinase PrsW (M82 family)
MDDSYRMIGFGVIVVLYAVVGLLAATGAVAITQKTLGPRAEQIFYGLFLVMIAVFYLAFVAYFGRDTAWRVETAAVVLFALVGVFGVRLPVALFVAYPLHGVWDLLHELDAQGYSLFGPGELTAVPLAYGVFCAAFDMYIAGYAYARRAEWSAAWMPQREEPATPPASAPPS